MYILFQQLGKFVDLFVKIKNTIDYVFRVKRINHRNPRDSIDSMAFFSLVN